jgi:stringent starvation protein A
MSSPTTPSSPPHLLTHPVSSYAQKILIALREKSVPFTSAVPADISLPNTPGPLHAANPRAEVPVLIHDGNTIFDSTVILEYIEDVWPEPRLLPEPAGQRAKARMVEEVCDGVYEAVNWVSGRLNAHVRMDCGLGDPDGRFR